MAGKKGQAPNDPNRGSRIVKKKMESGPNKGKEMTMRVFTGPDGKEHSAPVKAKRKL